MELEAVQLPQSEIMAFGDEGDEGDDSAGGEEPGGDLFGGGDSGDDLGGDSGDDSGGLSDLFASEKRQGKIMSEDEINIYDSLIDESEDVEKEEKKSKEKDKNSPIKPSSKSSSVNKLYTKNDFKAIPTISGPQHHGIHKNGFSSIVSLDNSKVKVSYSDLMDSIMPQSPVISNFVDKQLTRRMDKDLSSMSTKLGMGSKNKLLKEENDADYDILIDDNLFDNEEED